MKRPQSVLALYVFLVHAGCLWSAPGPSEEEIAKIIAAAPVSATVPPLTPRKLLLFNRNEGFDHTAIPYGATAVEAMGKKTGAYATVISDDVGLFEAGRLREFDAIFFNNGYQFKLDPAARKALRDFVEGGKGLAGVHAASANFEGWPGGTELFGAKFKNHPWTPKAEWAVKNEDPAHPLTGAFGGTGFRIRDEIYAFTDFQRERERVLLSLDLTDPVTAQEPHEETYVPVSWVHSLGKGRVFFCSLGHEHAVFWTPAVLRHLLDGIQFALGDLEADTTPNPPESLAALSSDKLFAALAAAPAEAVRPFLTKVEDLIRQAGPDQAQRARLEQQMLQVLQSEAPVDTKRLLCTPLSLIATSTSVPVMESLLSDPELSHLARTVLERVATPAACAALRDALRSLPAAQKAGAIRSLGQLRDRQSVSLLAPLVGDPEATLATAALGALGRLGGTEAARALLALNVSESLQSALEDACASCAESLAAEGLASEAEALYQALVQDSRRPRARGLGLRGLVTMRSSTGSALVLACLAGPERPLQRTAAQLCALLEDEPTVARLAELYPGIPPQTQVVLLTALADRGPGALSPVLRRQALPAAVGSLTSEDAVLRGAALRAVGVLGGAQAVEPLVQIAAGASRAEKQAAWEHLARLTGDGVEQTLLQLAQTGPPEVRVELMGVFADRQISTALPLLLEAARGTEAAVAASALEALGRLAGPEEYPGLIGLLLSAEADAVRQAAQEAVVLTARRLADRDKASEPLVSALRDAPIASVCALLAVLTELGGDRALVELTRAAASPDADVKRTAIQCLAEGWQDDRPLQTLLDLARSGPDKGLRVLALRGYLRLLGQRAQNDPNGTVLALTAALGIAERPEEKKQALSVARDCRVESAAELAANCLTEEALAAEAAEAVLYLSASQKRGDSVLPAVTGPLMTTALKKVRQLRNEALPEPWSSQDVGEVGLPGWTTWADGTFSVKASGADIWGQSDAFQFAFRPLAGQGSLTARVISLDPTDPWAKAGVMIRETCSPDSAHVFMAISAANGADLQWRPSAGAGSEYRGAPGPAPPYWVRLVRSGDLFTGHISREGAEWEKVGEVSLKMPRDVLIGLAVTSHNNGVVTQAAFDDVRVEQENSR